MKVETANCEPRKAFGIENELIPKHFLERVRVQYFWPLHSKILCDNTGDLLGEAVISEELEQRIIFLPFQFSKNWCFDQPFPSMCPIDLIYTSRILYTETLHQLSEDHNMSRLSISIIFHRITIVTFHRMVFSFPLSF